jgi:NADPH:quinone reductase-like Zn-dependent oxidoreductase
MRRGAALLPQLRLAKSGTVRIKSEEHPRFSVQNLLSNLFASPLALIFQKMESTVPATMRAWVRRGLGRPQSTLELKTIATPAPPKATSSDVLIRVSHVALQYSTEFLLTVIPLLPFNGPWIPELELSGTVVAAGDKAPSDVREPGTAVVAFQNIPGFLMGRGVLAEYVVLPGTQVARFDAARVDMAQAAGVNGAGSTALKMIRTAGVKQRQMVLVNGASGSVGSVLVQLLKLRGVKVVGVASGGNESIVRGFGADEFIDYRQHDLPGYLKQHYGSKPLMLDAIFDCVGTQALYQNSPSYLKPNGMVINIGALEGVGSVACNMLFNTFLPVWLGGVPRRYVMFSTPPTRDDAIYNLHLIEEGQLRIPVDSVFEMKDAIQAYERIATKRARGKVVVKMQHE